MTVWLLVSYLAYTGTAVLLLLSFPVPRVLEHRVNKARYWLGDKLLGARVMYNLRLVDFVLIVALLMSAIELYYVEIAEDRVLRHNPGGEVYGDLWEKVGKFRTERNWWISIYNAVVFYNLSRYISLLSQLIREESKGKEEVKAKVNEKAKKAE
jgi:hypothetical protein